MKYILTGGQIDDMINGKVDPKDIYRNCPILLETKDFVWEKREGGHDLTVEEMERYGAFIQTFQVKEVK